MCVCAAFRLFDRMMLLLRGRVVYFGPRGNDAVEYFKAAPLPEGQMMTSLAEGANEAEWIVDITTQADRQQRYITAGKAATSVLQCVLLELLVC